MMNTDPYNIVCERSGMEEAGGLFCLPGAFTDNLRPKIHSSSQIYAELNDALHYALHKSAISNQQCPVISDSILVNMIVISRDHFTLFNFK